MHSIDRVFTQPSWFFRIRVCADNWDQNVLFMIDDPYKVVDDDVSLPRYQVLAGRAEVSAGVRVRVRVRVRVSEDPLPRHPTLSLVPETQCEGSRQEDRQEK